MSVYDLTTEIDQNEDQFSTDHRELLWTSKREGRVFDAVKFARWAVENPEEFKAGHFVIQTGRMLALHGTVIVFLPGDNGAYIDTGFESLRIRREWTVASKDELESGERGNAES